MIAVRFCPLCGTPMVRRRIGDRQRLACPACDYIHYVNPVVAAGTLVDSQEGVLLVRRGVAPGLGKWALPAGYAEAGESPEETAIRETFEETEVRVALDGLLDIYSFFNKAGPSGVLILYAAHVVSGELRPGDDAAEARFFAADALPDDIAFEAHRKALVQWTKAKTIVCRPAVAEEVAVVAQIAEEQGLEGVHLNGRQPAGAALLVAVDVSRIVGFASLRHRVAKDEVFISKVYVQLPYRRWGIGTRLLAAIIEWATASGGHALLAEVSAINPGLMLFTHAGFHVCGLTDHIEGAALSLCYDLSAAGPHAG